MSVHFDSGYITFGTVGGSNLTVYARLRITTYTAYANQISIDEGAAEAAFECDGTTFYFYENAGGAHNVLTGSDTSWVDVAIVINGTAGTAYSKAITATSWTTLATWTSATTATVAAGTWPTYASSGNCALSALKMWNAVLTETELLQEATQIVPVRWLNIRFWNPMMDGATAHINHVSGGSNGTATGTPLTYTTTQSSLPWKRRNALQMIIASGAPPAVTGSGSIAMSPYDFAGVGTIANPVTSSGSLAMSPYGLSGVGAENFLGSGSLAMQPYDMAGAASEGFPMSGSLAMQPYGLAGVGAENFIGSGSLAMSPYDMAGAAAVGGVSGAGSLAMQPYDMAAAGSEGFPATGSLAMQPYGIAATGSSAAPVTGTGSLAMSPYELSGAADLGDVVEIYRTVGLPPNRPRQTLTRRLYMTGNRMPVRFTTRRKQRLGDP